MIINRVLDEESWFIVEAQQKNKNNIKFLLNIYTEIINNELALLKEKLYVKEKKPESQVQLALKDAKKKYLELLKDKWIVENKVLVDDIRLQFDFLRQIVDINQGFQI